MLYNSLLSLAAFTFCLSLFLVHRASVLENDIRKLRGDLILPLNRPRSEGVRGRTASVSETREDIKPRTFQKAPGSPGASSRRVKRDRGSCGAPTFLQLTANANKRPEVRGNIAVIPWGVSARRGNAISQKENKIVVQEDGYYLVFGQVLFESPGVVVGHVIQGRRSPPENGSTELLRCLRMMPDDASTCYTAGIVQLRRDDELELVIPNGPQAPVSMDAEATFFGVIQLN